MDYLKLYITLLINFYCLSVTSQTIDTLKVVDVISTKDSILHLTVINSNVPHYIIDKNKMNELMSIDIGDALIYIPGANIKDYGGIGGVKTISYRSLGAAHTGISVDGIMMPNTQTGVINLNTIETFNAKQVELTGGQPQNHFASAETYLYGNSISVTSNLFSTEKDIKTSIKLMSYNTSINSFRNGFSFQHKPIKNLNYIVQGNSSYGKGNYPFNIANIDSTYSANRTRAKLFTTNLNAGLKYKLNNLQFIGKIGLRQNKQELPGAIILYNPFTDQNLKELQLNSSLQIRYSKGNYALGLSSYSNSSSTEYTDNQFLNELGYLNNTYLQNNLGCGFIINRFLETKKQRLFIASDIKQASLNGSQFDFKPIRNELISVIGISKWINRFKFQSNITYQSIIDNTPINQLTFSRFSPFGSIAFLPFKTINFRIRSHYKNTFRLPSFNDLYYNFIGNTNLKPEDAHIFNFGITYGTRYKNFKIETTIDGYYNKVDNKIVAIPTRNLFNWSMQNIGKTIGQGLEINLFISKSFKELIYTLTSSQAYNLSKDVTKKESLTYGHQIPYTPKYTSSYNFNVRKKKNNFNLNIFHSGSRYTLNENISSNYLDGFTDINIGIGRDINIRTNQIIKLNLQIANIIGNNYEVIKSFPMPGRHLKFKLLYTFNS